MSTPERARFQRLAHARRMALARHASKTLGARLKQREPGLAMVTAGFRRRRGEGGGYQLHPEPCVILVVGEKWEQPVAGREPLPGFLRVSDWPERPGTTYAVPTDVQPLAWFQGARPRCTACVEVAVADPPATDRGTLTCAVRLDTDEGPQHFGLGALHVLSPATRPDLAAPDHGATLLPLGAGAGAVGSTAPWGGQLRDGAAGLTSFDVQLASLAGGSWLRDAFQGDVLSPARPFIRSREAFDALSSSRRFLVLAPANHPARAGQQALPMVAQFDSCAFDDVELEYTVNRQGITSRMPVRHAELLRMQVSGDSPVPLAGDSGAAVLTWWPDDGQPTLAGMFIASHDGDGARTIYVLPAWQLFKPRNWCALPAGTRKITPSFTCP